MDANDMKLVEFLGKNKTRFVIPVYQRNYDWKTEHCKQLLDDILTCGSSERIPAHFLGSIVYIHDDVYSSSRVNELTIIDGQQRLTTLTIMWLVLHELAGSMGDSNLVEDMYESYLVNKREEEKLKLRPAENNDRALQFLMNPARQDAFTEFSRLVENYEYFRSRITPENFHIVLAGMNKLMFVEISLERGKDDPQRIFESLNSTGLELSQADLIRNYILMGLRRDDQDRIYRDYWHPIEAMAKEESNNQSRVSDFIRDYLTIKNKKIPNKQKVYQEFKNTYDFTQISEPEPKLVDLKRYARHYNRLLNVDREPDSDIREQLHHINKLEMNVSFPFLIQVYEDFDNGMITKNEFVEVLRLIESFVWRRFIVGVPTNSLNKIFMRLHEDIDPSNYVASLSHSLLKRRSSQRFPRDPEIRASLRERDVYSMQTRNRTYLLERLENFNNNEPVQLEDNSRISIEHIFPQNPERRWKERLPEAEYKQMAEIFLNTLANLTLSGNNGSLGNKPFEEKRDLPDKGYADSRLYLNKYLASVDKWGVEELNNRYEMLAARFLLIWPCPQEDTTDSTETEEVSIFDADDPTHKKLDYAIFLDQKLQSSKVSDLFAHVFTQLFDLEPEIFFATDLAERVQISKDPNSLRQARALNDRYYIEAHLSNRDKFERLKYALTVFDLEDELYIRYSA